MSDGASQNKVTASIKNKEGFFTNHQYNKEYTISVEVRN